MRKEGLNKKYGFKRINLNAVVCIKEKQEYLVPTS
jgi:hypothetical protein